MPGLKDMTGLQFGKLKVLKRDADRKAQAAYWICQCECGNTISVKGQNLRNGKVDCGCGLHERLSKAQTLDTTSLIGKKFGKLTVKERDLTKPIGHGHPSYWICECDCGKMTSVWYSGLTSGRTKSCGCLVSETITKKNMKDLTNQRFGMVIAKENTLRTTSHHSYIWRCECDCGNKEYYTSAESLLSGRIHSCGCNTRSYGERLISEILLQNNVEFIQEYRFKDSEIKSLRYDFAILDNDRKVIKLIEFDGEQHFGYKKNDNFGGEQAFLIRQEHDRLKNEFALSQNIPLIRIPYIELNNLTFDLIMGEKYLIR